MTVPFSFHGSIICDSSSVCPWLCDPDPFEEYWSVFCSMSLISGLSDVFSCVEKGPAFLTRIQQKWCALLRASYPGYMMSSVLLIVMSNLITWKEVSAAFFPVELLSFPLKLIHILEVLWNYANTLFPLRLSSTNIWIHQRISPVTNFTVMFA